MEDLGDEEEELNSIVQLMMLHRQSFLKLQEDLIIQRILTNTCVVGKGVFESFVLELITNEECDESCILFKEPKFFCPLLPCELETSPISEGAMIDSTITIELTKGHKL